MSTESGSGKLVFRSLSAREIAVLTEQGCSCKDFSKVKVAEDFDPSRVKSTHFSGDVQLGIFEKEIEFSGGVTRPAGIYNAAIHNCRIGNNVYINHIKGHIANYVIEDQVVIENVGSIAVEGESSFGNGTEAAVVNEAGGREVPIYDNLSAQTAYIIAFYRHRPKVIENLQKMIADYTASVRSSVGVLGKGSRICNCGILTNIKAGPGAVIEGALKLENGSVNSSQQCPAHIGSAVTAKEFICSAGSVIKDAVCISRCFVGQGVLLGRQFSAENSIFLANCEFFGGEACSILAGPYTVSHHKSTLLIAGSFSFFNAGSGTNQSNHLYKLGPVHQGVVERGCKCGSDSYILWPARIGAYSVVIGRHYEHPDTTDLPFSYITEQNGQSIVTVGNNLRKIGLVRDVDKWPKRDRRKENQFILRSTTAENGRTDFINFKALSPYTIQKVVESLPHLEKFSSQAEKRENFSAVTGVKINSLAVKNGIKLYRLAVDKFLGDCLINRLKGRQFETVDELRAALLAERSPTPPSPAGHSTGGTSKGTGSTARRPAEWVDLAGLLAPADVVEASCEKIENGSIIRIEQLDGTFRSMHNDYDRYEWAWAAGLIEQNVGKTVQNITPASIIELVTRWKRAVEKFCNLHLADAQKEYTPAVQTGYGIDGGLKRKEADFKAVRGKLEENTFVRQIKKQAAEQLKLGDELSSRLEKIR